METIPHRRALSTMTPREYHARRDAERLAKREELRVQRLAVVREAILRLAPQHSGIEAVYLFGSILRRGRFTRRSDIDIAVDCDGPETESSFWRALENAVETNIDLRPRRGPIADAVESSGETVYERKTVGPRA